MELPDEHPEGSNQTLRPPLHHHSLQRTRSAPQTDTIRFLPTVTINPVAPRNGRRRAMLPPLEGKYATPQSSTSRQSELDDGSNLRSTGSLGLTPSVPLPAATPTKLGYMCYSCGSLEVKAASTEEIEASQADSPLERVFRAVRYNNFTLGSLLSEIFNSKKLSASSTTRRQVTMFLRNHTKPGTQPTDIFDMIYNHPESADRHSSGGSKRLKTVYHNLPPYVYPPSATKPHSSPELSPTTDPADHISDASPSSQPPQTRCTASIDQWMLKGVLMNIDEEVEALASARFGYDVEGRAVDWKYLLSFSIANVQRIALDVAPSMWSILVTICTSTSRRKGVGLNQQGKPDNTPIGEATMVFGDECLVDDGIGAHKKKTNARGRTPRDPYLTSTIVLLILLAVRNQFCNMFQNIIGLFLFSCNANRSIFSILNRIGVSSSYSTAIRHLHDLSTATSKNLRIIGPAAHTLGKHWLLIYDNINKHHRAWFQNIGKSAEVKNGTAATLVMMEDYDPEAMDINLYLENCKTSKRGSLTVLQLARDTDQLHFKRIGTGAILRIVTKYIPALSKFASDVENLFLNDYAQHRMRPGRSSAVTSLRTSSIDESKTAGNRDVVHDIVLNQLGLSEQQVGMMLIPVAGDQLSIDRLRKLKSQTRKDITPFHQNKWVLPIIALWHLRWALLRCIYRVHWAPSVGKGVQGLAHDAQILGRHINPKKCDYYPAHRLVEVSFEARILSSLRDLLREEAASRCSPKIQGIQRMKLLEELQHRFTQKLNPKHGAPDFKFEDLKLLALSIFQRTLSVGAIDHAQGGSAYNPSIYGFNSVDRDSLDANLRAAAAQEPFTEAPEPVQSGQANTRDSDAEAEDLGDITPEVGPESIARDENGQPSDEATWEPIETVNESKLSGSDEALWTGDQALLNNLLLMRDSLIHLELCSAVKEGDIGRVFKMIAFARFIFPAAGATNYTNETLEQACNFLFEFPPKLQTAILNNYLVNPTGQPNGWYEHDLLQEHHNLWIKRVFNGKNVDFDSKFLQDAVALNIRHFGNLREQLSSALGLAKRRPGRTIPESKADIEALSADFYRSQSLTLDPGRVQPFKAINSIETGMNKLAGGLLCAFLNRTAFGQTESETGTVTTDIEM